MWKPPHLARLLRDTIDVDRYLLSLRVQTWKGILAKISPEPPKVSLAPKGLAETRTAAGPETSRAAANAPISATVKGSYSGPPMTRVNVEAALPGLLYHSLRLKRLKVANN
jgi:hypothetical protein